MESHCYLPPDRGDSHAFTPGMLLVLIYRPPKGWQAESIWVTGYTKMVYP